MSFIEENREEIENISDKTVKFISSLEIDFNLVEKRLIPIFMKINSHIHKLIKNSVQLSKALIALNDAEKVSTTILIIAHVLNSDDLSIMLPEQFRNNLKEFCEETDTVVEVIHMLEWVHSELDTNNDGKVTLDEIKLKLCCCC